jgi:hypothetical protein
MKQGIRVDTGMAVAEYHDTVAYCKSFLLLFIEASSIIHVSMPAIQAVAINISPVY